MYLAAIYICISLALLFISSEYLVISASSIAKRFNISDFVIGVTIVAIGTSMPELISSLAAVYQGSGDAAVGNVVGSSVYNLGIILGLVAFLMPLEIHSSLVKRDLPFLFLVGLYQSYIYSDGVATRFESLLLLFAFTVWLICVFRDKSYESETIEDDKKPVWMNVCIFIVMLAILAFAGNLLVDSAITLARSFGVSEWIIGLTIVGVGTSTPELITSVAAAKKQMGGMSVGNLVGSDIFNQALILGVVGSITPIHSSMASTGFMIIALYLLILGGVVLLRKKLSRPEAALLLIVTILRIIYELVYNV